MRVGLIISLIGGVLTACGTPCLMGTLITPVSGFIAGWWVARQAKQYARPTTVRHALIAGIIVSLGGWLAQMIGYGLRPEFVSSVFKDDAFDFLCVNCTCGTVYAILTIPLSALGWKLKMR